MQNNDTSSSQRPAVVIRPRSTSLSIASPIMVTPNTASSPEAIQEETKSDTNVETSKSSPNEHFEPKLRNMPTTSPSSQVYVWRVKADVFISTRRTRSSSNSESPGRSVEDWDESPQYEGYLCLLQNAFSEKFHLAFTPKSQLNEELMPTFEQLSEYSAAQRSPVSNPKISSPTSILNPALTSIASIEIITSPHITHVELLIHLSTPVRATLPKLKIKNSGQVDEWLTQWFDDAVMELKRSYPGSSLFNVKPKYQVASPDSRSSTTDVAFSILSGFSTVTRLTTSAAIAGVGNLLNASLKLLPSPAADAIRTNPETNKILGEYEIAHDYLRSILHRGHNRRAQPENGPATGFDWAFLDIEPQFPATRETNRPIRKEEWASWHGVDGQLLKPVQEVLEDVFRRGIETELRPTMWPYLLGVYEWTSTPKERRAILEEWTRQYNNLRQIWTSITEREDNRAARRKPSPERASSDTHAAGDEEVGLDLVTMVMERKYRIEKDVHRTDSGVPFYQSNTNAEASHSSHSEMSSQWSKSKRSASVSSSSSTSETETRTLTTALEDLRDILLTYTMADLNVGYVQGMADLCSPILFVVRDAVMAFACFVKFMESTRGNFSRDQREMGNQLALLRTIITVLDPELAAHLVEAGADDMFWAFRWVLIRLKREFSIEEVCEIWEAAWAAEVLYSKYWHLLASWGIVALHRPKMMELKDFTETLKYVNDLSERLPSVSILREAERGWRRIEWRLNQIKSTDTTREGYEEGMSNLMELKKLQIRRMKIKDLDGGVNAEKELRAPV